jgi:deoxyribose-phosphate aldolase
MSSANHLDLRDAASVAALIDHTLLKPEATRADIERLCVEALEHKFASVCVNPVFLTVVAPMLRGSVVKSCAVVGFPLGANLTETKVFEARSAMANGAQELDMVIHIGALKSRDDATVSADIRAVADAAHAANAILKVIIETCLLTHEEKERACRLAAAAGADYVKTSTGFANPGAVSVPATGSSTSGATVGVPATGSTTSGATPEDVALMRRTVGPHIGVKASGGIRTLDDLLTMVNAGATRIGSSHSIKIVKEARLRVGL